MADLLINADRVVVVDLATGEAWTRTFRKDETFVDLVADKLAAILAIRSGLEAEDVRLVEVHLSGGAGAFERWQSEAARLSQEGEDGDE